MTLHQLEVILKSGGCVVSCTRTVHLEAMAFGMLLIFCASSSLSDYK